MKPVRDYIYASIAAVFILVVLGRNSFGKELVWKQQVFERYSNEEDIKDILRNIIRQNGNDVVFLPGVEGKITYRFVHMPLQGAFNMLLAQNALNYDFDSVSNTVTFGLEGSMPKERMLTAPRPKAKPLYVSSKQRAESAALKKSVPSPQPSVQLTSVGIEIGRIPLEWADGLKILGAAKQFGLTGEISVSPSGREVIVKGTRNELEQVRELIVAQEVAKVAEKKLVQNEHRPIAQSNPAVMNSLDGFQSRRGLVAAAERVENSRLLQPNFDPQILTLKNTTSEEKILDQLITGPPLDLSGKYRLSGIAKLGPSIKIAFIDGKEYEEGDVIGSMEIVKILDASVQLEEKKIQGKQRYVIRFPAPSKVIR